MTEQPKRGVIAKEWASYRELVVAADAGVVQVTEMRRAFYAGAWAAYMVVMRGLDPSPEPTAADLDFMEAVHRELCAFKDDVKGGRA